MGAVSAEVKIWNTPLIGAYILYHFTDSYIEYHEYGEAPSALLLFVALPVIKDPVLNETISNRRKNLQSFAMGFEDKKRIDLLIGIHEKVKSQKEETLSAIDIGVSRGLLSWDHENGSIYSKKPPFIKKNISVRRPIKTLGDKSKIFGKWCAEHELYSVCEYLKVNL